MTSRARSRALEVSQSAPAANRPSGSYTVSGSAALGIYLGLERSRSELRENEIASTRTHIVVVANPGVNAPERLIHNRFQSTVGDAPSIRVDPQGEGGHCGYSKTTSSSAKPRSRHQHDLCSRSTHRLYSEPEPSPFEVMTPIGSRKLKSARCFVE